MSTYTLHACALDFGSIMHLHHVCFGKLAAALPKMMAQCLVCAKLDFCPMLIVARALAIRGLAFFLLLILMVSMYQVLEVIKKLSC